MLFMLRLYSAGFNIPHPRKAHRGGEDSYVVSSPTNSTIAVADGVGGWESKGVNPRAFADEILKRTYKFIKNGEADPKSAIMSAYPGLTSVGSATLCVGKMTVDGIFRVANIGDSGFIVIRSGEILIESEEQQHQFNYPYQLGIGMDGLPHGADRPQDAEIYRMKLELGDLIIMGTDGLLDNLWPQDILKYIAKEELNPIELSKGLGKMAYEQSQMDDNYVPFFHRAKQSNQPFPSYNGGKEDDITVIVAVVGDNKFF
jgi:protein phosphatase PTC7|tara:strand:+ start:264 stop:1037 length:774 start_codon:yes stop_codon:yes gene_type:complete